MVRLPCLQTRTTHNGAAHRFGSQMTHQMTTQGGRADEWHPQRVGQAAVGEYACTVKESANKRIESIWKRIHQNTAGARNVPLYVSPFVGARPRWAAHARAGGSGGARPRSPARSRCAALAVLTAPSDVVVQAALACSAQPGL